MPWEDGSQWDGIPIHHQDRASRAFEDVVGIVGVAVFPVNGIVALLVLGNKVKENRLSNLESSWFAAYIYTCFLAMFLRKTAVFVVILFVMLMAYVNMNQGELPELQDHERNAILFTGVGTVIVSGVATLIEKGHLR